MTDSITDFLARHAKPYDPATDTYRRPPFAEPVKAGKNSVIYNAHTYHTKVPPEGIIPYIEHYTDPGDLVLDSFCGSGMTGVAALMSKRKVILNDLSPAAIHIAQNYTTPINVDAVKIELERIRLNVKEEFDWLYGTTCDHCGSSAKIEYTVWSDVYECKRCGSDIVLWDVARDEKGGFHEPFQCKNCGKEHIKFGSKRLPEIPVLTNYTCDHCKPGRYEKSITEKEREHLKSLQDKSIPYWLPDTKFDIKGPQYRRNALGNRKIKYVTDIYTKRNLWAFARLWDEATKIGDPRLSSFFHFALTSINNYINRKQSFGGGGGGLSGMIYIPSFVMEKNVWVVFERKIHSIFRSDYWGKISETDRWINLGSATDIGWLGTNSVDYVFSDPPFGSNIYYSEVNLLWEAWLQSFTDVEKEAVTHRKQDGGYKTIQDYSNLMSDAFKEIYRVLKPGRWASIVFHNSDDQIWQSILDAAENNGFEIAEVNAFDKVQLSFKGVKGAKGEERVTNKDIVLNLRKPHPSDGGKNNKRTHLAEAEQRVLETIADFLKTSPAPTERTLQHIWNHVLYGMIRDGSVQVSMAGLEEMLAYHYQTFKMVDGRYYLRGEAVVGGNVFSLQTDTDAITWLSSVLASQPLTTGELIPLWQRETAHLVGVDAGRLDRLLEQNFWQDKKTGRWRNPTSEEREKMNTQVDLSAQAHLRVVRRYLDGGLDHRPDDRELTAWIRFCYSREFYEEAAALFERINEAILDPEEYKTIKKMAAVAKLKRNNTQ
jgi:DNA modification methylase